MLWVFCEEARRCAGLKGKQVIVSRQLAFSEARAESILERHFWVFHRGHPEIYYHLLKFALEWRAYRGGDAALGIKALFERTRWELYMVPEMQDKEPPKLNNNHTAFYARLLMEHAGLAGIFKLRKQRVQATFGPDNDGLPDNRQVIGP